MNNKQHFFEEEIDLYEDILNYDSLAQYQGLLKHVKTKEKDLKRTFKKNKKQTFG